MKVCVVGAGVLGLTAAEAVSRRGHEVVVLDREGVFAGASHRSFAWLNGNNKFPSSYHRLNVEGIAEHERLQRELPDRTWLHLGGNILVDHGEGREQTYADRLAYAEAEGYPVERVDRAQLEALEPSVRWADGVDGGLLYPREGYVDNDVLAEELVRVLDERGVQVRTAEVASVSSDGEGEEVALADGTRERFDRVVLAAGAHTRQLAEASGWFVPVADLAEQSARTHSFLGLTAPVEQGLRHVFISDRLNLRPRHDGRMWVQVPRVESRAGEGEAVLPEVAATMEAELADFFGRPVPVERVYLSGRSYPEDGLSIVGFLDEHVYVVVTHSGMTLAPLLARLAAEELEGESAEELLADFRPSRFADGVVVPKEWDFIGRQ